MPHHVVIPARKNFLQSVSHLTEEGKLQWKILRQGTIPKDWRLQDTCNILETERNGISLRFCQGQKGIYFLHILNKHQEPVRLSCQTEEGEALLRTIAKGVPPLQQFLDMLDDLCKPTPPTPTWWQNLLHRILPTLA